MTKILKHILLSVLIAGSSAAWAQSTTSSPYSSFGLGLIKGSQLPQNRSLGGLSAGVRNLTGYYDINIANPASYSSIRLTTFDVGTFTSVTNLSRGDVSQTNFDASLDHLTFAMPVSQKSALSFGLLPYSSLGYRFKHAGQFNDTTSVNYVYSGEGGVSKAYLGYGFQVGKHFSLGFNASYLFGKLTRTRASEFPEDPMALSSREESNNSISGFNFDYGLQYFGHLSKNTTFTLGYSGSSNSRIKNKVNTVITNYPVDAEGNAGVALDTLFFREGEKTKIALPLMHTVGFTISKMSTWAIGADFSYGKWADYTEGNSNPGLQNSFGVAVGARVTPDINAVNGYFKLVDYRLGFKYDKTYISLNNTDINETAITLGFGFPLPSNRSTFYKINLGAELGQRGTLQNDLVRERFANIYLGFTLNDRWFQKYKFD